MANRIKIEFGSNPSIYAFFDFYIQNEGMGLNYHISKYLTNVLASTNHIKIGATVAETVTNIAAHLNLNNTNSGLISYSATGSILTIDFSIPDTYEYYLTGTTGDWDFSYEYFIVPATEDLLPLELEHDISIEVIDTYINERVLIEEYAQINAPKLSWDSGDDIYEPLMTSKLVFNMLVPDAADGKFFHLFTGDEKRYRVEIYSIKIDETKEMIWQGFLLPDLYNEPYQNGVFFVEFTAVDMIASLKGKTLKPWFYNNRFPIAQLFAYCLQNTGLSQEIIVSPSLVPASPLLEFKDINVPLYQYAKENKYDDCYKILTEVLEANGLTLYSFRGRWFVKGISRKHEVRNENSIVFDIEGIQTGLINVVNKVSEPMMSSGTPNINGITPWKSVNIDITSELGNLFSEDVIKSSDWYGLGFFNSGFIGYSLNFKYQTRLFKQWYFNVRTGIRTFGNANSFNNNFNYVDYANADLADGTEQSALVNYFDCPEQPYLVAGNLYELEFSFNSGFTLNLSDSEIKEGIDNGYFDLLVPFQVFINNTEIMSNRPSFINKELYRFEVTQGSSADVVLKLKLKFKVIDSGYLKFRVLLTIGTDKWKNNFDTSGNYLKINVLEDDDSIKGILSSREINFTQKKEVKIAFTSNSNNSVKNNLGLGSPINLGNYTLPISRLMFAEGVITETYGPNSHYVLSTWEAFKYNAELLFTKGFVKNVYLYKVSGVEIPFTSLYLKVKNSKYFMGYLKEFSGFFNLPKGYKAYSDAEIADEDELKVFYIDYDTENISLRDSWKLVGYTTTQTFVKTLAALYHFTRPEPLFSLESTYLQAIFPNELIAFNYMDQDRNFIPTRLEIDLFDGKTTAKTIEAKFVELEDIVYE
jgi:hypothetical protein